MIKSIVKPDIVGAMASGLCVLHCIATPFLFLAQCSIGSTCCGSGSFWWSSLDYIFMLITFLAVRQSGKRTTKPLLKHAMYTAWVVLSVFTLNEKISLIDLSGIWKYSSAIILIALHLINLKTYSR